MLHATGDLNAEVATMGELAEVLGDRGFVDELRAVVASMERILGSGGGDDRARAELDIAIAYDRYFDGDMEGSAAAIERALGGLERAKAWDRFRHAITVRAYVLNGLGRDREATILRRGILAMAQEEHDLQSVARAMLSLALYRDEPRQLIEESLEAAEVARRGGYGELEMTALANALESAVETAAWRTADGLIADLSARTELPLGLVDTVRFGQILLAAYRGDRDAAAASLAAVSTETSDSGDPTLRAWFHRVRAVVALMAGDAIDAYDEAMTSIAEEPEGPNAVIAASTGGHAAVWLRDAAKARALLASDAGDGRWAIATRRALEAGIVALEGRTREASSDFESVLAGRLASDDRFSHALITLDAVAVLPSDDVPESAVETASAYLEEIGAEPLLARLERPAVSATTEP